MARLHIQWWLLATVLVLAGTTLVKGPYATSILYLVAIASLLAGAMRFPMLIGELSFATAAFVGIGAYGAGIATTILKWPFPVALVIGPLAVVAVSILFGMVTLRIKGPYFMLIGFAFAEAVRIAFTKTAFIGGVSGMPGIFPPRELDPWMPVIVVSISIGLLFALYAVEKSDFGKLLVAIRDSENVTRSVGVNILFCKVTCFVISAFCAGVAGSLHAFTNNVISPGDFGFLLGSLALAYVKVGGESSIFGAILGAVILVLLASYALGLGGGEHLFYGAVIVLAMLLLPRGLIGLVQDAGRRWRTSRTVQPVKS